ncbi:MAG: iron-containing alcohol dehydrogenase [Bacillota bacterium]|nr:iron-containing alcohol dehydrogenase [Bacillota bacterium]
MDFRYKLRTNLIFGTGKESTIGREAAKLGNKVMIVTGGNSTKKSGLLDRTRKMLEEQNVEYIVFDKVQQNPVYSAVDEGASLISSEGCCGAVAIGGGSVIDSAKAICAAAAYGVPVENLVYEGKAIVRALPLIAVPTTCGTGSEVNGVAVLTNEKNNDKKSIKGDAIIPAAAIVDPLLMTTMPKHVYASVSFDALCHLMEAYLSVHANPITDMIAAEGMMLISDNILEVYRNYDNIDAWEKITLASTLGGYTLNAIGVIAGHGMEHPESGLRNVMHGKGLAAVMPVLLKELAEASPVKTAEISRIFGGKDESDCWQVILKLLKALQLDLTLDDLGFSEEDISWLTDNAFKVSAGTIACSPKQFEKDDIRRLYHEAMTFNKAY